MLIYKNFDIPHSGNNSFDYMGAEFPKLMKRCWETNDYQHLYETLETDLYIKDDVVIKHGHLILNFEGILNEIPDCKFITCIREPYDMLMDRMGRADPNYNMFGCGTSLLERINTLKMWYNCGKKVDSFVVRLEDLLYNKKETMKKVFDFVDVENEITFSIENIINEPSESVGKGKEWVVNHPEYIGETKNIIEEFRKEYGYNKC